MHAAQVWTLEAMAPALTENYRVELDVNAIGTSKQYRWKLLTGISILHTFSANVLLGQQHTYLFVGYHAH